MFSIEGEHFELTWAAVVVAAVSDNGGGGNVHCCCCCCRRWRLRFSFSVGGDVVSVVTRSRSFIAGFDDGILRMDVHCDATIITGSPCWRSCLGHYGSCLIHNRRIDGRRRPAAADFAIAANAWSGARAKDLEGGAPIYFRYVSRCHMSVEVVSRNSY